MSVSMEERLKRRKLDALKRGVHRVTGGEDLPVATHVVGIGRAGARAVSEILRNLVPGASRLTALVVDIGEQDLGDLRALAARIPAAQADVTIVALEIPPTDALFATLSNYRDFLRLEYPNTVWNPRFQPWLDPQSALPAPGQAIPRAVAKAIYGQAFYGGERSLERVLRGFASGVDAVNSQPVVAIIFGIGGGTGSGIAADLARHLSSGMFGRRALVAGIGIAPCDGDAAEHGPAHLFPVLCELDCLGDEGKNRGIVASCGELFRNPYTAGFIMMPLQPAWEGTKDLAAAQQRCNEEIAALVTTNGGAHLWELLRLLNWVAAPSTQHSAARTPWGAKWIHMLGYADLVDPSIPISADLPRALGLRPGYQPEFIEIRVADPAASAAAGTQIESAFHPDVPPSVVAGGRPGSVQFILPCVTKHDLIAFAEARAAYDATGSEQKLLDHALLLEHGVLLCEPSTRIAGMAGASLWGGDSWIAVPLADIRGDASQPGAAALESLATGEAA
jgi:hypothetical protein